MEKRPGVTIRPLRPDEQTRFLERIVETTWHDLPQWQQEQLSQQAITPGIRQTVQLLMEQGKNTILVADMATRENVGQVWLGEAVDPYTGEPRGYIYDLYVEPGMQNRGLGRALLIAAEEASRARGDRALGLTVAASNEAAQALYRSHGFEVERYTMSKLPEE